jgi:hypothetical protein
MDEIDWKEIGARRGRALYLSSWLDQLTEMAGTVELTKQDLNNAAEVMGLLRRYLILDLEDLASIIAHAEKMGFYGNETKEGNLLYKKIFGSLVSLYNIEPQRV